MKVDFSKLVLMGLLLALLLVGCGGEPEIPPTPTLSVLQLELGAAADAWQALGIDDYQMRVRYRHPGWDVQELDVVVEDGVPQVEAHSCFPERRCAIREVETARFTVDNVLAEAQARAAEGDLVHTVYHESYHFPRIVEAGEGDSWELSSFEVTEASN